MITITQDDVYTAAAALGIAGTDKAVHTLVTNPAGWSPTDVAGTYTFESVRTGEVYTVSAAACTCPAYTKPVAAGDPPKECYHRRAVTILTQQVDQAERARREADRAAYRAT